MQFLYVVIILIILILVIIVVIWMSSGGNNIPPTPTAPQTPGNSTPVMWQGATGETPIFTKFSQIIEHNPQLTNGKLFELCPCQDGYECVQGLCRRKNGQECNLNRECASDYCIMGQCVNKPPQVKTVKNAVCLFGQIMMLNDDNNFSLVENWIDMVNINHIIRNINDPNIYHIVADNETYLIKDNEYSVQVVENDLRFRQLFYFMKDLYGIGVDGFLYKIRDENSTLWQLELIINFQSYDLTNVEIMQAYTSYYSTDTNGIISFKIKLIHNQEDFITYNIQNDKWEHQKYNMVYYIDKWSNRVEIYKHEVLFYYNNKVIDSIKLDKEYIDIIYTKNGLYLTDGKDVSFYKPNNKRTSPDTIYKSYEYNNYRNVNKYNIKRLLNTESQVWLILNNICFDHK